jgi:hypothetical protein
MFYRASGMVPGSNVGPGTDPISGVQLNARRVSAYNTYQAQQIGKFRSWLQRPDTAGLTNTPQPSLARQGLGAAFLRYAADRAIADDSTFFKTLVNSNLEGLANIQNAIGGADPYDWMQDFQIALYVDDNAFTVASKYQTPSWNYRAFLALLYGSYSIKTNPLTNGVGLTLSYMAGGSTAFVRFGVPATGFANIRSTTASPTPLRYSWLRTK